jgi:tetratricopeptide (TPR) repeat protein
MYHVITVLLVFLVINALTGNNLVAFLAALLFSIHPVHTESVAYISGRRDILSTLFYLLGFYSFIRYRASSKLKYSALFLLCYLLALGSKEMAVTLPLLCFCYDMVGCLQIDSTRRKCSSLKNIFRAMKEVMVRYRYFYLMFLIAVAFFTYYKVWIRSPSQRQSYYGESIYIHFLTVFKVMIHYLKLMFYPINLTVDYSYNGFPLASSLLESATIIAILMLVVVLYGLWKLLNTSPLLSFGALWWFLTLLPVCQIFPHHELLAEHYLYLPSVGFFLCVALVVTGRIKAGEWRKVIYSSLCLVIVIFSMRTACRNRDWRNCITLWEKTVKIVPNCVRAQNNLGVWYYKQGRYQEAKERHQIALSLNPDSADSYNNLGNVYLALGLYREAEENYKKAIQIEPTYERAYSNLGMVYIQEKRYKEAGVRLRKAIRLNSRFANPYYGVGLLSILKRESFKYPDRALQGAMNQFKKAIKYNPEFAEAHSNLGSLYTIKGRYEEAERELVTAIQLKPDLLEAHKNLAELYEILGRKDKVIEACVREIKLNPESGEAHYRLGILYRDEANYGKALAEFKKALDLKFDCAEIHNELGILYKVQGNYRESISEYKKALSLSPDYLEAHYNMALAYQNMGSDDEALKYYQRAITLKPDFPQALNNMGSVYARRGNYEKAITLFKKVVDIDSDHALAHNNLGNVYRERGHYLKAIEEYEIAASLDSSYSDPHFNLAQVYLKDLKEIEKALYHYKESIARNPNHPQVAVLKRKVKDLEKMMLQPLVPAD